MTLAERRQEYEIVGGNLLNRQAGFLPGRQPADDYIGVKALFAKQVRHPGARRFARSSTVQKDQLVLAEGLDCLFEVVGFKTH